MLLARTDQKELLPERAQFIDLQLQLTYVL